MPPTIVLVHGAFAESASWDRVIDSLRSGGHDVMAAPNPLRSLAAPVWQPAAAAQLTVEAAASVRVAA